MDSSSKGMAVRWPRVVKSGSISVKFYRMKHASARSGFIYVLSWVSPSGRQRRKFAKLEAAEAEAHLKADQLQQGRVEGGSMSQGDRDDLQAARALCDGVPLVSAMKEWAAARKLCSGEIIPAAKAWRDLHVAGVRRITVPDAVDEFLKAKTRAGVDVTCSYDQILPRLKPSFTGPMETVTASALTAWIYEEFAQPVKGGKPGERVAHPSTVNTARKRQVALWRWARKVGYLPATAQTEAERIDSASWWTP